MMRGYGLLLQAVCLAALLVAGASGAPTENLKKAVHLEVKTTLPPIIIKTTAPSVSHVNHHVVSVTTTSAPVHHLKTVATTGEPKVVAVPVHSTVKPVASGNTSGTSTVHHESASKVVHQTTTTSSGGAHTTLKPVVVHTATSNSGTSAAPAVMTPAQRVSQYFDPVCHHLEKLQPKQLFKIQAQMKKFVEKTAGKMSLCFMQHYSIDPNLTPVDKQQLRTICASRTLDQSSKGSFKAFLDCASHHYDPSLDAELARINKMRANCSAHHEHSKNDTLASLTHDDDELSLITEVVNKVIAESKDAPGNSNVKVIDVAGKPVTVTTIPLANDKHTVAGTHAPTVANVVNKNSATESNNKVVHVEEKKGHNIVATTLAPAKKVAHDIAVVASHTTIAPKLAHVATQVAHTTAKVVVVPASTTAAPKVVVVPASTTHSTTPAARVVVVAAATTSAPATVVHHVTSAPTTPKTVVVAVTTAKPAISSNDKTTAKPAIAVTTTTTNAPKVVVVHPTTVAPNTSKPTTVAAAVVVVGTTKKPEVAKIISTTTTTTTAPKVSLTKSSTKPTAKIDAASKKVAVKDDGKKVVEKVEKKKQAADDSDAKKAVKSLQAQRAQAHGSPSDVRMHQIEHERQMAIDPVGHTIKHQEYELKKKQKAAAAATTTKAPASSSTKKPQ